jgi:hypothetical protein
MTTELPELASKRYIEFVESFHLIESSLFEPSEDRRIQILENGETTGQAQCFQKQ